MKRIFRRLLAFILFFAVLQGLSAEFFADNGASFVFDLPEGFTLADAAQDGSSYLLKNSVAPVEMLVRVFPAGEAPDAKAALNAVFAKLGAKGETAAFTWRDQTCVLSGFTMQPPPYTAPQGGWALAAPLPDTGGFIAALVFSAAPLLFRTEQFALATLDSLHIDEGCFLAPGPVTAFTYPEGVQKTVNLSLAGLSIPVKLREDDSSAASFVIEREFSVLTRYADSPLVKTAWQRYYRQIYRDAYSRLLPGARSIVAALSAQAGGKNRGEYLLRTLLAWVQEFPYARNFSASDFEPLPSILEGGGSDCDSRAMLLAALLNSAGCNALMFFSPEYKHAVLGVESEMKGAKIAVGGVEYLLAETTAKVEPGLIARDMADTEKWIPVIFPR